MRAVLLVLALSYVSPAYSILRRLADTRDDLGLNSIRVEGNAAVAPVLAKDAADALGISWESGELQLRFVASVKFPGRCRVELSSLESTKTVASVWANGKAKKQSVLPVLDLATQELCTVLALRGGEGESRAAIEKHLSDLKVNTKSTSLGRFAGKVTYVVGDTSEGASQFWVYRSEAGDRQVYQPARLKFDGWDVQFQDFTNALAPEWFPRVIAVHKQSQPQLRLTMLSADAKVKVEDALFQ